MNKNTLRKILLAACFLPVTGAMAQSEDNVTDQIASMEYKQWKFSPRAYYYSWDYKRVLGIKIPIPGLGIHDNGPAGIGIGGDHYVDEKWRQMSPLRVTATAESLLQRNNVDDEREYWNKILEKDVVVYTDRSTDLPVIGAWTVTKDERDRYSQEILNNLDSIATYGQDYEELVKQMNASYDHLGEELDIIRGAHEDNADKLRQLQNTNGSLDELRLQTREVLNSARFLQHKWVQSGLSLAEKYRWNRGKEEEVDDRIPLTAGQ